MIFTVRHVSVIQTEHTTRGIRKEITAILESNESQFRQLRKRPKALQGGTHAAIPD